MKKLDNPGTRDAWITAQLKALAPGTSLLDVGAGECPYKQFCDHLTYVSQDVNIYDGEGNKKGLQTGSWSFDKIDIRCDILEIPEDRKFNTVLCTEVLEHVPDPVKGIEKIARLVNEDSGRLIITAPFASLTHFAPYHYSTGFSEYFYRFHLKRLGFKIEELTFNGGFFDFVAQELGRVSSVHKQYLGRRLPLAAKIAVKGCRKIILKLAAKDSVNKTNSSELLSFGLHVVAIVDSK
jgi:ubiquinone/menaquinone biosynthesis C-methylase UbiE